MGTKVTITTQWSCYQATVYERYPFNDERFPSREVLKIREKGSRKIRTIFHNTTGTNAIVEGWQRK